jgi:hypothetical protein
MLRFFKILSPKIGDKNCRFRLKTELNYAKKLITIFFGEKTPFFVENCRKSQEIVIITSVPGNTALIVLDYWAWGLACGLSPKSRPVRTRAFGLCS